MQKKKSPHQTTRARHVRASGTEPRLNSVTFLLARLGVGQGQRDMPGTGTCAHCCCQRCSSNMHVFPWLLMLPAAAL
jgi:hypothetical protein